ncbi:MAG: SatD family protein [Bacteroidota bacterium]
MMKKYLVIIGDIEDSKSLKSHERENLQGALVERLEQLNNEYKEKLLSPYTITLGDEFQAVFNSGNAIFVQMLKIMAALHPIRVRFSLAVGGIDTPINNTQAIGMDGPAFHQARHGINLLKESGYIFNIFFDDMDEEASLELKIINNSLQLLSGRMGGWNKRRIIILHMIKEGYDYKEISKMLEISQPAFYKNKEAGMLDVVGELCQNITAVINQRLEQ